MREKQNSAAESKALRNNRFAVRPWGFFRSKRRRRTVNEERKSTKAGKGLEDTGRGGSACQQAI